MLKVNLLGKIVVTILMLIFFTLVIGRVLVYSALTMHGNFMVIVVFLVVLALVFFTYLCLREIWAKE